MILIEKLIYVIPLGCGVLASYTDIKEGKIRNKLTYPMIISGIVLNTITAGMQGFLYSICGISTAFMCMAILPGFRHGGGDIKLGMGFGAYMGYKNVITLIWLTLAIIVLVNIALIIKRDGIKSFVRNFKIELCSMCIIKTEGSKIIEGPIILTSYCITMLLVGGGLI